MKPLLLHTRRNFRVLLRNAYEVSCRARSKEVFRIDPDAAPPFRNSRNLGSPVPPVNYSGDLSDKLYLNL